MSLGRRFMIVAAGLLGAACGQTPQAPAPPTPVTPPASAPASVPPSTVELAGSFTDVHVLADGAEATVFYKTFTSLADCAAQVREMPLVWHEHVRGPLTKAQWTQVTLWPEETSHRSAGFTFRLDASGNWCADAPCLVRIAP